METEYAHSLLFAVFVKAAWITWLPPNESKISMEELNVSGGGPAVAAAFTHFGVETLVVKPQISAGSDRTTRVTRGMPIEPLAAAIIQPFISSVGDVGEWSLFWIGGAFSHAARKVAAEGEFRVQPQFGGMFSALEPSDEAMAIGQKAIDALPAEPLYARIDLVQLADGSLALIELEAIEPDLYPDLAPHVPARLAQSLAQMLR